MNIQEYFKRINFTSKVSPTKEVLFELQSNHLENIPFENLDIHYGSKIELNLDKIFDKIVTRKRGGFCYELNSIFNELLIKIGFKTFLISARVYNKNGTYGQEFDHMAIIVEIDTKLFLVDVGFGKFTFEPLELIINQSQLDKYGNFMIDKWNNKYYRVNRLEHNEIIPEYIFEFNEKQLIEFEEMCKFHQSNHESHFTKNKVISISKPNGRITLTNTNLKITEGDETKIVNFNELEFDRYLYKYFNIRIEK